MSMRPPRPGRNLLVERAVSHALDRIDYFISGAELEALPSPEHRRACDALLARPRAGSAKVATLFLMFYWLEEPTWDRDTVPVGIRGQYGDKLLSEQLNQRDITLHDAITAFAENVGWKGDVHNVKLLTDYRLGVFLSTMGDATPTERSRVANYLAYRFAESKTVSAPLPHVGADVLTFARAKELFYSLLDLPSEGHIQQFLIAALLFEFRRRHSVEVSTHHPHAADRYDATAGDIEERRDGVLVRAYEVTVRDDWQNRLSVFKQKMDRFGLAKYLIIAAGVNSDEEWSVPANMALFLERYGRDIAVVDIKDVVNFLTAELSPTELRAAVNKGFEFLSDRRLSGREPFKDAYRETVSDWLDTIETSPSTLNFR